jgi:hypothetical protein
MLGIVSSYFIEKIGGYVMVSHPRRVDSYDSNGDWIKTKAGLHLDELASKPVLLSHSSGLDSCSDVVDLLWNAMMLK